MKKIFYLLIILVLSGCEDEFPEFNPSVDHVYGNQFMVWQKKDIIRDLSTGEIRINESRDIMLELILEEDRILRSTNGGETFDTLTDIHISLDSIAYCYPNNGFKESFFVTDIFRMPDGDPRNEGVSSPRDEKFPELKDFYLFLELENKKKSPGENSEITHVLLMYAEGYPE